MTTPDARTVKKNWRDLQKKWESLYDPAHSLAQLAERQDLLEKLAEAHDAMSARQLGAALAETAEVLRQMSLWAKGEKDPAKTQKEMPPQNTADLSDPTVLQKEQRVKIYTDGASKGNPGPSAAGILFTDVEGTPLFETGVYLGEVTNNVAEYEALIKALELVVDNGCPESFVFSDSALLVNQMNGKWKVRHPHMMPLIARAQELRRRLPRFQIVHVPRENNKRADELANLAIRQYWDKNS